MSESKHFPALAAVQGAMQVVGSPGLPPIAPAMRASAAAARRRSAMLLCSGCVVARVVAARALGGRSCRRHWLGLAGKLSQIAQRRWHDVGTWRSVCCCCWRHTPLTLSNLCPVCVRVSQSPRIGLEHARSSGVQPHLLAHLSIVSLPYVFLHQDGEPR